MRQMRFVTTNLRTGEKYIVLEFNPRRRRFGVVPFSHSAQDTIQMDRREFTKPEWEEV